MITIKKGYYQIDQEVASFVLKYQDGIMFHTFAYPFGNLHDQFDAAKQAAIAKGVSLGLKPNRYSLR